MAQKPMSSRLLTMKFMQRGMAASAASSPTTPHLGDDPNALNRRKIDAPDSPSTARGQSSPKVDVDATAFQSLTEDEERRRRAAIAKQAAELGDTHWILDFPAAPPSSSGQAPKTPLRVVQIGFAQIDSGEGAGVARGGQMRRFNMKTKAQEKPKPESDGDDSLESSQDDEPIDTPPARKHDRGNNDSRGRQITSQDSKRKRATSEASSRINAERTRAHELSAKRRKKEVKLNMPMSISSANSPAGGSSRRTSSGKDRR